MITDFTGITALSDQYGVITQIADASGNVLWKLANDKPIILEVEKITSNTYAAETTYTGEKFILLDIYPKTNGTVKVSYGGLTKTITDTSGAAEPNAQKVFFGKFNGVSDSVSTPASGELTIKGDYMGFGGSAFEKDKSTTSGWYAITAFIDWGVVEKIPYSAFGTLTDPGSEHITTIVLPESLTTIGVNAFRFLPNLTSVTFEDPNGWTTYDDEGGGYTVSLDGMLDDPERNVTYLNTTYNRFPWKKK